LVVEFYASSIVIELKIISM